MNKFSLVIGLLVVGMIGLIIFVAQGTKENRIPQDPSEVLAMTPSDEVAGNRESPVVLVEYLDFECPACRANHPLVKDLVAQHGDRVAVVTRHFPLPFHRNGQTAAWAFEAAAIQGKGEEMADLIFNNQQVWAGKAANAALFYPYAQELELNMEQFQTDIFSDKIKTKVQQQIDGGRAIGVNSTPTFFLHGQRIQGMRSTQDFISAVEEVHTYLDAQGVSGEAEEEIEASASSGEAVLETSTTDTQ